jgi:MoxR-like ATPase
LGEGYSLKINSIKLDASNITITVEGETMELPHGFKEGQTLQYKSEPRVQAKIIGLPGNDFFSQVADIDDIDEADRMNYILLDNEGLDRADNWEEANIKVAADEALPKDEEVADMVGDDVESEDKDVEESPKPKRKRRTREQIEADKLAAAEGLSGVVESISETAEAAVDKALGLTTVSAMDAHEILGQDDIKKMLVIAAERNMPVMLVGDTGCGKTSIVKNVADDMGHDWVRFNLTGETTVDDFVGKYVLENKKTVWQDGILLQAMRQGKWLIVDEINAALPEILFALHSLLDDDKFVVVAQKDGEVVKPHEDFRFFATMNPVDEYAGTKDLNKAFKSRFNMIIDMHYPYPNIETEVVSKKGGIDETMAAQIVDTGVSIRKAKENNDVYYTCSTRDLIMWAKLVDALGMDEAFKVSILSKSMGDAEKLVNIYRDITGQYLTMKKAGLETQISWFKKEGERIKEAKKRLRKDRLEIEERVKKDILEKLSLGSGL